MLLLEFHLTHTCLDMCFYVCLSPLSNPHTIHSCLLPPNTNRTIVAVSLVFELLPNRDHDWSLLSHVLSIVHLASLAAQKRMSHLQTSVYQTILGPGPALGRVGAGL